MIQIFRKAWFTVILPAAILILAGAASGWLVRQQPSPNVTEAAIAPEVQVLIVQPQTLRLPIASQGVLQAVHEAELSAEVQGKVMTVHPDFLVGGMVRAGQVLANIDPGAYDLAIVAAEARLAEIKRQLAEEQAAALQAQREWQVLGHGKPTPLSLHEPQLAEAKAKLKQAEAELALARKQRQACAVTAPFSGRISNKAILPGQFVNVGQSLGRLFALDVAEIRLPVTLKQAVYLDMPDVSSRQPLPKVQLSIGISQYEAELVRREGLGDGSNGLDYWVARLRQPELKSVWYPGTFVTARIQGRELAGVFVLPQAVLTSMQQVLVVDQHNRLRIKPVNILQIQDRQLWIDKGLNPGDRVVLSGVDMPIDGMAVAVAPEPGKDLKP